MVVYLKGSDYKIEDKLDFHVHVVRKEGKQRIMNSKQRYKQKCGFSQSPVQEKTEAINKKAV